MKSILPDINNSHIHFILLIIWISYHFPHVDSNFIRPYALFGSIMTFMCLFTWKMYYFYLYWNPWSTWEQLCYHCSLYICPHLFDIYFFNFWPTFLSWGFDLHHIPYLPSSSCLVNHLLFGVLTQNIFMCKFNTSKSKSHLYHLSLQQNVLICYIQPSHYNFNAFIIVIVWYSIYLDLHIFLQNFFDLYFF